jgi:endonuclease YncB( thermonuclease family)
MFKLIVLVVKLVCFLLGLVLKPLFGKRKTKLPRPFEAQVYVVDGDTVGICGTDTRIRLYGIDAPERGQSTGHLSTRFLKNLALNQILQFKPLAVDRYGRIVAQVYRKCDGLDVNAEMVKQGYALADTRYSRSYDRLQKVARRNKRGLWRFGRIEDPKSWRQANS